MGVNLYNNEGYLDLTAYEALTNVERGRQMERYKEKVNKPIVFICSPFAGDIEGNVVRAKSYGRFAVFEGMVPIIPHLMYPQFLIEKNHFERKLGIEMGLVLLTKCKELWVFGDVISPGMAVEISKAKEQNIIIRQFTKDCELIGGLK